RVLHSFPTRRSSDLVKSSSLVTLDVVSKTGKTPVLGRMLSKYVGHKMSSIENEITKTRNHSRQRGNMMRTVFGIDVSKASSEVRSEEHTSELQSRFD